MSDWSVRAKEYGRWAWRENSVSLFSFLPLLMLLFCVDWIKGDEDKLSLPWMLALLGLTSIWILFFNNVRKRIARYKLTWKETTEFDESVREELLPGKENKLFLEHLTAEQYKHGAGYVWYFANQHKDRESAAHQLVEQEDLVNAVGKVVRNVKEDRDPKGPSRWLGWLGCLSIPIAALMLRFAPKRVLDVFVPAFVIGIFLLAGPYFWLRGRDQINEERLAQFHERFSGLQEEIKEILRKDSTIRRLERASQK
ncbi:MAG: hypothetical protein R2688_05020 [Fimbriimonadaceae bacterium]